MSLSITTNLMAANAARNLTSHYAAMSSSVRRLSSGLRVSLAADDAAGLAIRELMRADIASLTQGVRNANDAISLIQTADGALGVIDEKLIRMKELAEQAATGTYNSDQRLLIHSEFQAMASEIERIATATEFNGIKLLDGFLSGAHDGSGLTAAGSAKIHFGAGNDAKEDYYCIDAGDVTLAGLGLGSGGGAAALTLTGGWWEEAVIDRTNSIIVLDIEQRRSGALDGSPAAVPGLEGIDFYQLPVGLKNITIVSDTNSPGYYVHKPHVCLFTSDGEQLTGPWITDDSWPDTSSDRSRGAWWNNVSAQQVMRIGIREGWFDPGATYACDRTMKDAGESLSAGGYVVEMVTSQNELKPSTEEVIRVSEVTSDLVFMIGGHAGSGSTNCNYYKLRITAEFDERFVERFRQEGGAGAQGGGGAISIRTQDLAQQSLEKIDGAIVKKDKIRAHLGALQNRFENTASSLRIQAENTQAAESRISDMDAATEMTALVRSQILAQAATAMLVQANSVPKALLGLLNG